MKIKNNYQLAPTDGHKSFYGKAVVFVDENDNLILQSYATIVAVKTPDGEYHRTWGGWSATTGRHLAAFGLGGKAVWSKMPVENFYKVVEGCA